MSFSPNFFIVILTLCLIHDVWPSCVFQDGKYDLSALDWPAGWPVSGPEINGTSTYYEISICRPLNYTSPSLSKGCPKSSICQISGEKAVSFGKAIEKPSDYAIADNVGSGFSLYVLTRELCGSSGVYRATINFACGPNLGAPELILWSDCQVNFFWRTSAACINKPKIHQVPCYVIDKEGNKRDLSQLILRKGSYPVETADPSINFTINVCSEILDDEGNTSCGSNSSACRVVGDEYLSFGKPQGRLQYTQEGLVLSYSTDQLYSEPPKGCNLKPKTTIYFNCPRRDYSQPPILLSDLNCQYEIKWDTEYACPENLLKGSLKTCQFTAESHGVEIDLSPLKKKPILNIPSRYGNSTFALSVCGGLGNFTCSGKNWKSTSVCANETANSSMIIGTTDGSRLVYADGVVILTYPGRQSCNNDTDHSTVVSFVCDPDASNDGEGEPKHVSSDHCIHMFEWKTKYVCLKRSLDIACSVTFKNKTVNLRKLSLVVGEAWEAIDRRNMDHKDNAEYYINICGRVAHLGNLSSCGEGSSACVLDSDGKYLNLGNFTSPPVYDKISDSIRLTYTGGSPCKDGKQWKSTIDFICRSGHINSEPVLVHIDDSECQYKFEWHTAEACPEGLVKGANCKIHDDNLGINYDLTPFKNKVYEVDSESYKFYIGICEPVMNSSCSLNQNSSQNVGICREDKINHTSVKIGESSSDLSYLDGVVTLNYLLVDPLNKTTHVAIIVFICDYDAGNGSPRFAEELKFGYVFHWYTSLVCSNSVSTECVVHDPFSHLIYDLSGLSISEKNWVAVVNEDNKERKIYLNICRPLAQPLICDSNAAACMVEKVDEKEKVVISDLGHAVSPPVLDSPGHLTLKYTNGNPCVAYGENITYSTVIHFLCAEDKMRKNGLRFLSKVGACEYAFLWTTKAACPTGVLQSVESCQLTDPDSGFTFDLTPLWKSAEPYTVTVSPSSTFQLNICGKVVSGCFTPDGKQSSKNVSVCETDLEDKLVANIAVSDSYLLSYSTGRDLSITYKSFDDLKEEVIIKFPCSNTTADPNPKFVSHENKQYIFEMKTSLTCIPAHFDCNVIDQYGNEYDLSPLAKYSDGNWEVADNRPNYSHLRYHINFCRPLNKVVDYKCPGGSSGACQTNVLQNENVGRDLGSQMNEPVVNNKGTVVLRYTDGSYCHNGQFKRSTTVNLFCSGEQEDLKFIGETPECEYIFSLATPVACPIQSSFGSACTVKDPFFGYIFDLNPLKSKNNNYNVTVDDYNFYFNVCDKLNGFENACINSSACQTKPKEASFSKSLGLPNDRLIYRNGLITLEYKSGTGSCHGKYNRSARITFTCHHALEDKDGPYFVSEAEDCTYLFEWPTVHACPPFDVIECSVIGDNGAYYDLSRLSLPNENYYVKHPMYEKNFVINVCRSVVHTPDSVCPYTSASCIVDVSNHPVDEPVNLGRVGQGPYIDNGKLKINYTSGDPCDVEGTETARFMQTVIEFICDRKSIDSKPEFVGRDGCTYYFDWHTVYACESEPIKTIGDCTAEDPLTGYLFNLSSLRSHGLFKYQKGNHQYYVSVCGNDDSSPCGADSGMCQEELIGAKRHWSGGKPNNHLVYNNGIIFLNYSDGDPCHNGRFTRNTLIEFHCGNGIGEPKFLYESHDCTYFFSWKTELACQSLLHCAVKNGSQYYDLTSIAGTFHLAASSILNDNASYFISVCNSLQKLPEVSCPPGAGICKVQMALQKV
ncbi:cation-independent mannose-6-phosphate receptor-like isoform X1 [Stegodyphus dumicola]|uniref:cation-independent mannose-6-phosphate receptor-like isoform X1 n=1 Tax=Stegodyphus dumicola TaxID=202533 RepID=UPI0015AC446B|nr:cation-independent mannose-6-phosphate receptor-like isoform X1 [Stegodyphus dumicola]